MKKLLSLLLVGMFTWISFASADCLDNWLSSESDLNDITTNASLLGDNMLSYPKNWTLNWYVCVIQDVEWNNLSSSSNITYYNNNKVICSDNVVKSFMYEFSSPISSYSIYSSSSPITYVSSCSSSDNNWGDSSDTPLLWWVWEDFASGITSWVWSLTSWISNVLPTLILLMLPLLLILLFRKYLYSWIKHVLVWNKPRWDDVFNCNLKVSNGWEIYHDFTKNGVEYVYVDGVNIEKSVLPDYLDENLKFDKLGWQSENVYYWEYYENLHYMWLSDDEIDTLFDNDMKAWKTPEEASSMSYYDRKHYDEYLDYLAYEYWVHSRKFRKKDNEYIEGFKKDNWL